LARLLKLPITNGQPVKRRDFLDEVSDHILVRTQVLRIGPGEIRSMTIKVKAR
jgi:hypothetical protein